VAAAPRAGGRGRGDALGGPANTGAEDRALVEEFRALREAVYRELIDTAGKLRRKATIGAGGTVLLEELVRIERDFRI
jgi:hypothetical protein